MSNPLFSSIMGNNVAGIRQRLEQIKKMYPGDPNQYIQKLLNSGQVTQANYNRAVQQAQQIQQLMGIK